MRAPLLVRALQWVADCSVGVLNVMDTETPASLRWQRDEARRECVLLWCQHVGTIDEVLTHAASKWGRTAALALYPDAVLFDFFDPFSGEFRGFDSEGVDELPMSPEDESAIRIRMADARAMLDEQYPEEVDDV